MPQAKDIQSAIEALLFDEDGIGQIETRLGGFNIFELFATLAEELQRGGRAGSNPPCSNRPSRRALSTARLPHGLLKHREAGDGTASGRTDSVSRPDPDGPARGFHLPPAVRGGPHGVLGIVPTAGV